MSRKEIEKRTVGTFAFRVSTGKVKIRCTLAYARYLVNNWRTPGGVFTDINNVIYL